ncbi:exonuclease domain-containing protein [Pseudoalteromonas sp.]|uniref:3'-5' exonuclease n=1 Tax=Pseudoalteromonas sp. TaxID=53249 RepID=UPI00356B4F1A
MNLPAKKNQFDLYRSDIVVLDTETTGLDEYARVCEISIIDGFGNVLLDTLVNPEMKIPQEAINIHNITNDMVANAPTIIDLGLKIQEALSGKTLCIYNSGYDTRLLNQSFNVHLDFDKHCWNTAFDVCCIMLNYAEYYGELQDRYGRMSYRWQRLTNACAQQDIDTKNFTAHRALGDCQMTLALMNKFMNICEG